MLFRICAVLCNFYPRPPRGGRLCNFGWLIEADRFLSTPSARRATRAEVLNFTARLISIHALREEGDVALYVVIVCVIGISIHALREEGDALFLAVAANIKLISIHALREEGDHGAFSYLRSPL